MAPWSGVGTSVTFRIWDWEEWGSLGRGQILWGYEEARVVFGQESDVGSSGRICGHLGI